MEQLGIQPSLLLAQIVNFAIIAFVLTKLLYKPILSMLEKRKQEIQDGLALTEKMRLEEEKMKAKHEKFMETARTDARDILEKAKKEAQEEEKRILAEAHTEATALLEKAKVEGENYRTEIRKDVQKESIQLAQAMVTLLTKNILSQQDQHKLVSQQIKKLETMHI
jgi:F-type H+-transporting ATPase subunit b